MELIIQTLNNAMSGVDFRSILNTNFANIKQALQSIDTSNISTTIFTDAEIEETSNYNEGDVQIVCDNDGVRVKKLVDGVWQIMCEYTPAGTGYITMEFTEAGIGYPVVNTDDALEGFPVGYVNGVKTIAGTPVEGSDPVHAVGWYKEGQLTKTGRIKLDQELVAGTPVWVLNGGGWTIDKPVISGNLGQVIGFVSDDGLYIDIDIQPWIIVS